ncbi:MAG TPA: hypothetical protein VMG58_16225, partial [Candidatus Sulfotelmatobacter sp.]|nr:hypothetical protein [Candidatus Sulfotelmatobacter sp.]
NAPAGNGAIAFGVRGPVHTLVGEEPVGTQALALAAELLHSRAADRCLVVGTEERNAVIAAAYAQVDRAARRASTVPPFTSGAAALVLERRATAEARGARALARLVGWGLARASDPTDEAAVAKAFEEACQASGAAAGRADHVVLPTARHRSAAQRALRELPAAQVYDLAPRLGNPAGAANLLQAAASVALLAAGRHAGPGLVLAAGVEATVAAIVLTAAEAEAAWSR